MWGLCVKGGIFQGGFLGNLQYTKELRKIKGLHRDLIANLPNQLLPLDRGGRTIESSWPAVTEGFRRPRNCNLVEQEIEEF
jgi:hypothetical protein